ncbi:MAG TPA: thiamine pyrophosphate-dependent enzyme [Gaiellales bacterium]|nr:thiamine pyrophosphate-dependent enzyme [Gaiellales bacterium]
MDREQIVRLAALATGDEKHEASSYSTLDVLAVLYGAVLRVDPARPDWPQRDRFILSKGHGPAAFYAVLCLRGFFPESWLPGFMTWGNPLGAHPDRTLVPGVEASTGSLGHGLALAVGTALALRAQQMPEPRVVVLTGDAELNEGSNWESVLLAPQLGLDNLTVVVVDNHSSSVDLAPLAGKLGAFGWDARTVPGRDHAALEEALGRRPRAAPGAVVADIPDEPE